MLDDPSQSVASWFDKQLGTIIAFAVLVAGIIAGYVRLGVRVDVQGKDIGKLETRVGAVEECQEEHLADTTRHIDPVRDERRWQEMKELIRGLADDLKHGIRRVEDKVDTRNEARRNRLPR
jgi:hypothetical protein